MTHPYDVLIIGGGINGCGIAADLALRGLRVALLEQGDLASQTSSASTKLIHGGLRYLEQYDFALVKKSLDERATLMALAPNCITPMPFVIPKYAGSRPDWMIRLGLWLYDHISRKNRLPRCKKVSRSQNPDYFAPLNHRVNTGYRYYDAATDDARLTINNALLAQEHGAHIYTRTRCDAGTYTPTGWEIHANTDTQQARHFSARAVINAAGTGVNLVNDLLGLPTHPIRFVKGSHIIVRQQYTGEQAYLLQHDDQRVIFIVPFYGHTLIGTTEVNCVKAEHPPKISPEETQYLLSVVHHYLKKSLTEQDIVHSYSGIRTLLADDARESARTLSRDYHVHYHAHHQALSIYGGKITTYRQLAIAASESLRPIFPHLQASITHKTMLPCGIMPTPDAQAALPWVPEALYHRWVKNYGTRISGFLTGRHNIADLGQHFGGSLYQCEVDYLITQEWARSTEDILWRRTSLGLTEYNMIAIDALSRYIATCCA